MEIADPLVRNTETWIVSGELRIWRDLGENTNDKLVWEFENCEVESINIGSKELIRPLVLTEAGLGRGRSIDGRTPVVLTKALCEPGKEPQDLFAAAIHDPPSKTRQGRGKDKA